MQTWLKIMFRQGTISSGKTSRFLRTILESESRRYILSMPSMPILVYRNIDRLSRKMLTTASHIATDMADGDFIHGKNKQEDQLFHIMMFLHSSRKTQLRFAL